MVEVKENAKKEKSKIEKKSKRKKTTKKERKEKEFVFSSPGQNVRLLSLPYS